MLYLDKVPVQTGTFPNGETYVDIDGFRGLDPEDEHTVVLKFRGNDDLIDLMLLKRALDDAGISRVRLVSPFFPYSTMDRTEGLRALSCKYVSAFINSLNFTRVDIWEAHSSVVLATLDRVKNDANKSADIARQVIHRWLPGEVRQEDIVIVFPDAGAAKRYHAQFDGFDIVTMEKTRAFRNGAITGIEIAASTAQTLAGKTAVIVDDLCRAGGTFVGAAEALKKQGVSKVLLCVAHAEEGIYSGKLLSGDEVDGVYTTDSCMEYRPHEKLHLVETVIKEED